MALALRLRRALVAAATSSSLLRPVASASLTQPLPLLLPGTAGGFLLRAAAAVRARGYSGVAEDDDDGCDYEHWLIRMRFPEPKPSREEMIETYLQTLAQVVGSYEQAKKLIYAFSTTTYIGFQAVINEEMIEEFYGLPGVLFVVPDAYAPYSKEYGGDRYDNGVITEAKPLYPYWGKSSRPDKNNLRGKDNTTLSPQANNCNDWLEAKRKLKFEKMELLHVK